MKNTSRATPPHRPTTPAENLRLLAARLSDHLSPAEKRELEVAAQLLGTPPTMHGEPSIPSATGDRRVVYQCPRCATSMEVDPTAKPSPLPDKPQGETPRTDEGVHTDDWGIEVVDADISRQLERELAAMQSDGYVYVPNEEYAALCEKVNSLPSATLPPEPTLNMCKAGARILVGDTATAGAAWGTAKQVWLAMVAAASTWREKA